METFKIRSYSKKELALCYFPTAENPRSASKHLMAWITRCTPLHEALLKAGIPHDFISRPGTHNWTYWTNSLDYQMLFFSKAFEQEAE